MTLPPPTIDLLLTLIDTRPHAILSTLTQHPHLASARDTHGYSLVHAAASYNELDVLRTLVQTHAVDVDLVDEDGETALFAAEKVEVARCLVEELGADIGWRNGEGRTAEERIGEEDGPGHEVVRYLRARRLGGGEAGAGAGAGGEIEAEAADGEVAGHAPPPPLPEGVRINMGTMEEDAADAPDPEIRRRIEELAARPDYESDEVQRELRELVQDVVSGMGGQEQGRSVKRRVE